MEIAEVWVTFTELQPLNVSLDNSVSISSTGNEIIQNTSTTLSPFSISAALMMLMLGTNGRTKSQISSAIFKGSTSDQDHFFYTVLTSILPSPRKGLRIKLDNEVFVNNRYTIQDTVKEKGKEFFRVNFYRKNFIRKPKRSSRIINRWISKKTMKNFDNLISREMLKERTVAVFVNTVSFKADWKHKFNLHTTMRDFYVNKTTKKALDMMRSIQKVRYGQLKESEVLVLPLKGDKFDMVIILPEDINKLQAFEKLLSINIIRYLNATLVYKTIDITLPKFVISNKLDLKGYLPTLGITDIFNKTHADFKNLIKEDSSRVYVSDAFHDVVVKLKGNIIQPFVKVTTNTTYSTFIGDRPFLYYILDRKSGVVIFMGRFLGK
ncbi:antithrombin-III-like [Mytilus californianus]|uniref:antithrombin-III-like n=1 Tax=Mytilus californianus TaxID=6549 RepID=UPI00224582BE|nr:antithrombin-III-like [Mytilus californianus]